LSSFFTDYNMGLNILLIGGSGFVSGALAQAALANGHQVWAVTRGQRPLSSGVHGITIDRRNRQAFAEAIGQRDQHWDLVVDCIGFEPADAQQDIAVFRTCAAHLVFISTDLVYEPVQRRFPQGEESEAYLTEGYGGKKRQCELALINGDTGDMRWTVLRPCHIYGPGSLLGCLPLHGRDPALIDRLQRGEPLQLVGGGHFLQQPILATDLAETILSCAGNAQAHRQVYVTAGPDIVESWQYYAIIAEILGVMLQVEEVPVAAYRAENPDKLPFLCHRIYDLSKLRNHGLHEPATSLREGLRRHVQSLLPGS
jgi:nucleoside-diphosphate-sugar epimerase